MNVLLYAPSIFVLLLQYHSLQTALESIAVAAMVQVAVGLPFLLHNPWAYLKMSFDLGRQFIHHWSVNFKFVPEHIFLSRKFAIGLLGMHVLGLALFATYRWCTFSKEVSYTNGPTQHEKGLTILFKRMRLWRKDEDQNDWSDEDRVRMNQHMAWVLASGQLVGVAFARSLHYQFYSWYFHSLPLLLWMAPFHTWFRLLLLLAVEVSWNVFPSTTRSSVLLCLCHLSILLGAFLAQPLSVGLRPSGRKGKAH